MEEMNRFMDVEVKSYYVQLDAGLSVLRYRGQAWDSAHNQMVFGSQERTENAAWERIVERIKETCDA